MIYKVDFLRLPWVEISPGVRHKSVDRNGVRLRMVEYSVEMQQVWCTAPHYGQILHGRLEITFRSHAEIFEAGDGLHIPGGEDHGHRVRCLTPTATALIVDQR